MNIGFDAKRAYHNGTGLGNYSRTLINTLAAIHPEHEYFLFNPKQSGKYRLSGKNLHEVLPQKRIHRLLSSVWRSILMKNDILKNKIDLYQDRYKAALESMEGAALHYICRDVNIPFIQIRSVSNYVGERNKAHWKMKEAIYQLNETLLQYIEALYKLYNNA